MEQNKIYIISKIWTDPLENTSCNAVGYRPVGYVMTLEEAEEICSRGKELTRKDCWAITGREPEFIYKELNYYGTK